jgi:hypothetical protein
VSDQQPKTQDQAELSDQKRAWIEPEVVKMAAGDAEIGDSTQNDGPGLS